MPHPRVGVAAIAALLVVAIPTPSHADGVWDPDEPGHRLDIRWVGVYQEDDGRFRVTITFYDRVRPRWFHQWRASATVGLTTDPEHEWWVYFAHFFRDSGRLKARLCESGSTCGSDVRVSRPNAQTIRVRFAGGSDWDFSGWTGRDPPWIDRTRWQKVT